MDYYDIIADYTAQIRERIGDFEPEIAGVLGSGLNGFADSIKQQFVIDYASLPNYPICSAKGHVGRFVFGEMEGKKVVLMQGRVHYYEGYSPEQITLGVRIMRNLGAETILFSNAAGSMRDDLNPGDFMVFTDQMAFLVPSPLVGLKDERLGDLFPDTTGMFDKSLREIALQVAKKENVTLKEGVYIQASGPQYESPMEMKAYALWGADAVGMSTCMETIAALQCGFRILAVSCITNYECGLMKTDTLLSHEEVLRIANKASSDFDKLMKGIIRAI